jgi:hypothetical protein
MEQTLLNLSHQLTKAVEAEFGSMIIIEINNWLIFNKKFFLFEYKSIQIIDSDISKKISMNN